jgi:hypothetical protein
VDRVKLISGEGTQSKAGGGSDTASRHSFHVASSSLNSSNYGQKVSYPDCNFNLIHAASESLPAKFMPKPRKSSDYVIYQIVK